MTDCTCTCHKDYEDPETHCKDCIGRLASPQLPEDELDRILQDFGNHVWEMKIQNALRQEQTKLIDKERI